MSKIIGVLDAVLFILCPSEQVGCKKYPTDESYEMKTEINKRLIENSTVHIERMNSKEKCYSVEKWNYWCPCTIWCLFL